MSVIVPIAEGRCLQITRAWDEYRAAGQPLAGALRLGALYAATGKEGGLTALYGACLAAHGHRPDFSELRALAATGRALVPRTLPAGQAVIRADARPDGMYLVHQGRVAIAGTKRSHGPMTVIGFASAATGHAHARTVVTTSPSVLLYLPQPAATALFTQCPVAFSAFRLGPRHRRTTPSRRPAPR